MHFGHFVNQHAVPVPHVGLFSWDLSCGKRGEKRKEMGRKVSFRDKQPSGPGRKARKQGDPKFSKEFLGKFKFLTLGSRHC